ncbi:MAG: arginine--tRNA ligase, partial [Syntrophales bacterium LBB04]|nr:arginine--tRNA ligase [Syntrophales bacterium LBB04]
NEKTTSEYYENDKGGQISILGKSVFLRYLELLKVKIDFPEDCYQGQYIKDMAGDIVSRFGDKFINLSADEGGEHFRDEAAETILKEMKKDLADFRVTFDNYFSEKSLALNNKISACFEYLKSRGFAYEKDGALWFESTKFGDDKDRVLVKTDGQQTYLASDIPYHEDKLRRGYDLLIDILGPDHHGYIGRLEAAVQAYGFSREHLKVIIVQLATLYKGGEVLRMSTRRGTFITLRELIDEVGVDAARYFLANRKTDTHLDFDLELAKKQTPDNPVFYVQYAGARINSIISKAVEKDPAFASDSEPFDASFLGDAEKKLISVLSRFPEIVANAARNFDPQAISTYLEATAAVFQSYYSGGNRIITDDKKTTFQKLIVCRCFKRVIENGLNLLGIVTPERM